MSITQINGKKFVENSEQGNVAITSKIVSPGQKMAIYVPKLMPLMVHGGKVHQKVVTQGNMVFKNAPECKPNAPMIVETQNYISPTFENNATWTGVSGITGFSKKEQWYQSAIPKGGGYTTVKRTNTTSESGTVKAGTTVRVTFKSGNLLNPTFNPN